MRPLPIEAIPGAPPFVLGASIIRGMPTPVIELGILLSGDRLKASLRMILLKTPDNRRLGLMVTDVMGLRPSDTLSLATAPPLLAGADASMISGLGRLDESLLTVLQLGSVVPEEVWNNLLQQQACQ